MNARNVARALTTLALAGALAAAGSMPALAAPSDDHPGRLADAYQLPTGFQRLDPPHRTPPDAGEAVPHLGLGQPQELAR